MTDLYRKELETTEYVFVGFFICFNLSGLRLILPPFSDPSVVAP